LDYNRAGVSLLEIVTEPDFESGEEAELFIQELRRIVRYLGVCNGNMEEGSLRADANVSINILGKGLGKKVEIKNLNSSRFVRLGLNYEIRRQSEILDAGKTIVQETRLWDESRGETMPMRQKEDTQDYRYFPEPDLPVFCPDDAFLASVNDAIVELPRARMTRIKNQYGLSEEQAELICGEKESADYFEAAAAIVPEEAVKIANWFLSDIKHILTREGITIKNIGFFSLNPNRLASLVKMISEGRITAKLAKQCMELAIADNKDPEEIVKANNWEQLSDPEKIAAVVKTVLAAEKKAVSELRTIISSDNISTNEKRRKSLTAYLVGKVLAATGGRADPKTAGDQVNKLLSELHYSQGAENE